MSYPGTGWKCFGEAALDRLIAVACVQFTCFTGGHTQKQVRKMGTKDDKMKMIFLHFSVVNMFVARGERPALCQHRFKREKHLHHNESF